MTLRILLFVLVIFQATPIFAQLASEMTIRYDLRRSINGRYQGLAYGEVRLFADLDLDGTSGRVYQYRLEELSRDGRLESRQVVDRTASEFEFRSDVSHIGSAYATPYSARNATLFVPPTDDVVVFQNFPVLPGEALREGLVWQAPAVYLADPGLGAGMTRIPVLVEYRVAGRTEYSGQPAWSVQALYALRYRGDDPNGDPRISSIQGSHRATITYADGPSTADQVPLFFRIQAEEAYGLRGGGSVEQRGFILGFYTDPFAPGEPVRIASEVGPGSESSPTESAETAQVVQPPDRTEEIRDTLASAGTEDVEVTKVPEGYSLEVQNLLFVADQAELLAGETQRLDRIAQVLRSFPDRQFLVTGHTANVGSIESQIELSIQRAKRIVDELADRGIEPRRLMYEGRGGFSPLGDNTTEEGRRRNRRVEITIIEL